jgi:hypothetical protein
MLKNKVYVCHLRNDPNKEILNKVTADSFNDALQYFADRKRIDETTFLRLFSIEEYEDKSK